MQPNDTVYLKAANVFCALRNRYVDEPRKGPLTITRVYDCGNHTRIHAVYPDNPGNYIDAAVHAFETT